MPTTNPHEQLGRERKARKILAVIDDQAALAGLDVHADALTLAAAVRAWPELNWARASVLAGQHPASAETRELILRWVEERYQCPGCGRRDGAHAASCSSCRAVAS